jgi:peptidyl-prolyl cis-trans isomerase SurA
MRRLFVLLLVLPSALAAPGRLGAETIERVVAKVNGQIITLSEFQARQIAAAQAARVDPAGIGLFLRQNNAKILQEAVDELLILQKAEDAGQKMRPEVVDEVIDSIKKENNITSEDQFQQALEREGLSFGELRQNIERSMTKRMIVGRDIEPKIAPTETEIKAEYEKLKGTDFTKPPTVTLQEILVKEDAGGLPLAQELLARARAGEDFQQLARQHSAAPSRANGGDIGQIAKGDMNPALEKIAFQLPVGGVSEPTKVAEGYRIVKLVAKTDGSTTPYDAAKDRVRDKIMLSRYEKEYDNYMTELRKGASIELRVREVPLQLTGPIPEGSLLEALEPLGPTGLSAPAPAPPAAAGATDKVVIPTEKKPPVVPTASDDEVSTSPQAAPEKVAPPPAAPPAAPKPKDAPPHEP